MTVPGAQTHAPDTVARTMKGKIMATVMDYRTQDGLADYGFSIDFKSDTGWQVYIIFLPFDQGHDDSMELPYQSIDGNGRRYVGWSTKIDSMGDARTVAALWAELIHRYQRSQERGDNNKVTKGPERRLNRLRKDAA